MHIGGLSIATLPEETPKRYEPSDFGETGMAPLILVVYTVYPTNIMNMIAVLRTHFQFVGSIWFNFQHVIF